MVSCDAISSLSNARAGHTVTNHHRCLFMTSAEFIGRVRAAQALTEDFDAIVNEFGRGCPCKNPPLKSTGKAHLKSTTHDKAFNKPGGKFFGKSVREAFMLPVVVVHVQGAQRIGEDGDVADAVDGSENAHVNELDQYDEMDFDADAFRDADDVVAVDDADDDVSDIVLNEGE